MPISSPHAQRRRVLVAEDDCGIRTLLTTVLRRAGFEVDSVGDGVEALEALRARNHHAALIDLLMPAMDGYAVIDRVLEFAPGFLSRIIVLSAAPTASIQLRGIDRRVFRVMQKPFDLGELIDAVGLCLDNTPATTAPGDRFLGIRDASEAAGARAAVVALRRQNQINLVWGFGFDDEMIHRYPTMALDAETPLGASIVQSTGIWLPSQQEIIARYPMLRPLVTRNGTHALAAAPIVVEGRAGGAIGWSFSSQQPFDDVQKARLLHITEAYGSALTAEGIAEAKKDSALPRGKAES